MPNAVSISTLLFGLALYSCTSYSSQLLKPLHLLTWEDFLDEEVIEEWQRETGIPIHQTFYDDEAQRNLVLTSSSAREFDLAVIDQTSIRVLGDAGYIYPVAHYNQTEFWPNACGSFGRAYLWGTYGIGYRADKLQTPITSWASLMKPAESLRGHIGMLGQADELLTSALSALSYPIDSRDDTQLKDAFALLKSQSSFVATYEYIYSYIAEQPESDNIWVAPMYSGDHEALNEMQGIESWTYVIPAEGSIVWIDCMAIVTASGRKRDAQDFIDFLSRKEISARNSEALAVASPFIDAVALQNEDFQSNRNVYLSEKELESASLFSPLSGQDMLKRIRIKDALIRYYDTN